MVLPPLEFRYCEVNYSLARRAFIDSSKPSWDSPFPTELFNDAQVHGMFPIIPIVQVLSQGNPYLLKTHTIVVVAVTADPR